MKRSRSLKERLLFSRSALRFEERKTVLSSPLFSAILPKCLRKVFIFAPCKFESNVLPKVKTFPEGVLLQENTKRKQNAFQRCSQDVVFASQKVSTSLFAKNGKVSQKERSFALRKQKKVQIRLRSSSHSWKNFQETADEDKTVSLYFTTFTATKCRSKVLHLSSSARAKLLKDADIGKLAKEGKTRT